MTNFTIFAILTISTKIPKIAKIGTYPKNGQNWDILENGLF